MPKRAVVVRFPFQLRATVSGHGGSAVIVACAVSIAMCCGAAHAEREAVSLRGIHAADNASRVSITLKVNGSLQHAVQVDSRAEVQAAKPVDKTLEFPLRVVGRLMYDEVLRGGQNQDALSAKSVRHYHHAEADVRVGKHADQIRLRDDRRFVTAAAVDEPLLYCLDGPLTREELDLIDVPGDSLLLDQLLPQRSVQVGDKWKPDLDIMAKLVNWNKVSDGEVICQLTQIVNGLAIVSLNGRLTGKADSAESSIQLSGEFRYDIHWRRITWLQLDINEKRQSGLVQPGFDVATALRMRVQPVDQSQMLTAGIRAAAWQANPDSQSFLLLKPRSSAIEMTHDRRWHLTGDFPRRLVMRCLDEGKLLAQLNVSELAKLPAGRVLSLEEFQKDTQEALGDRFREFISATKDQTSEYRVLRIVAAGIVSDVPIHWIYYHVNDPSGRRAVHSTLR